MPDVFDYTPDYLTKNGEPWFPVMGEIHYSRCCADTWKEELLKMKAGGVTVVSAYAVWIHHEEIEGAWDFTGCRDLRRFIETCRDCGLYLLLRIGPWCHGEVRNGGFPDWLLHKGFEPRTNDSRYFDEVAVWYSHVYEQCAGLLLKDGGPVIGVQIENEYGHCGGLSGDEGERHMKQLRTLAEKTGFDVPLYTATGWGGAVTAGMIPVMGGYVDAPWDPRTTEIEPSGNYVITYERNDHAIGSDFGHGGSVTFDVTKFPYLTAELGGGLEPTFKRRPVPTAGDIGAETLVKLASGVNLLGYYMYHGGTNPKGRLSTLQESRETGSLNDLLELSYDFFAPVGEFGRIRPVYGELKLYALFAADFGASFCTMNAHIPEDNPLDPEDMESVRYSWRYRDTDGGPEGFLFVNNYVRHHRMAEHAARTFTLGKTSFSLSLRDRDYFFLPFNMPVADALLEKALVTPLCILHNTRPVYVFYRTPVSGQTDDRSLYTFRNGIYPSHADILTLSRQEAEHASRIVHGGTEYLIITEGVVIQDGGMVSICGGPGTSFTAYPPLPVQPEAVPEQEPPEITAVLAESTAGKKTYELSIAPWSGSDCFVSLYYEGNCARLYENGRLADDHLFCGRDIPFEFSLKHVTSRTFRLEIDALGESDDVYLEDRPRFTDGSACTLVKARTELEYRIRLV